MEVQEYIKYRTDLLEESKDEDGFITESAFIETILPFLSDAKLIDSDGYNDCYFSLKADNIKINGYKINESEERLQLFIVNEDSLLPGSTEENLLISLKGYYDSIFSKASKFINKSIKKHLNDEVQETSSVKSLINFISSSTDGLEQIDVIEIFLISATATVERRGIEPQPKIIDFEDDVITVNVISRDRAVVKKDIFIYKRLIDLNYLYNVLISQGNREVLEVNFEKLFGHGVQSIRAADEFNFESYLCVLPANILAELYKRYSTRMLEKNVRSFLQFKGVNQGIRDTIRKTPEYFIAYNNGLTITAVGAEFVNQGELTLITSLKDFQIVNGGQTTATIYFSKKEGLDISKIKVMAKVNVAKNVGEKELSELISNISRFSNAQSKVSNADLRSRSEELIKLKSLSESTLTPSGKKWYFERFKGEFNTLLRKNPNAKTKINNEFPKERRFTKEELAKYYMSWDAHPYLVKKGGDKIFRTFIEQISGSEKGGKAPLIDRDFFEELIAKIILFQELVTLYGSGKNAMGQLRSAVVPYTISILYVNTSGSKNGIIFDLLKIWQQEGLDQELKNLLTKLMELVNELIKKYSSSEDYGEYSKRKDLWDLIYQSKEIKNFINSTIFINSIKRYSVSKDELQRRLIKKNKLKVVDFSNLSNNTRIFAKTAGYYKRLIALFGDKLSKSQVNKLDYMVQCINNKIDIPVAFCEFEEEVTHKIRIEDPEIFDQIQVVENGEWYKSFEIIFRIYNNCLENGDDIISAFQRQREIARLKGAKFYSVYDEIGKTLKGGKSPTIKQIQSVGNIQWDK